MNKKEQLDDRPFPFEWPWKGVGNSHISLNQFFLTRKFTYIYFIVIWGMIFTFDFASTKHCDQTWQTAMYCEYAFWVKNFIETPFVFIRNLFTTPLIHNGFDHILFVTGSSLISMQSYELRFGFKETVTMFFLAYVIVGSFFGFFYNYGLAIWPENQFFQYAFQRNWVGGSVGCFFLFGALIPLSKKPFILLSLPFTFELINFLVVDIDPHISLMHLVSVVSGFALKTFTVHHKYRIIMSNPVFTRKKKDYA